MPNVGFDKLHKKNATVDDTLALIIDFVREYSADGFAKSVAKRLHATYPDKHDFLRALFDYYCRNIEYCLDPDGIEQVYTPARTISEGKGDCKKASIFLASVLQAAGIEPVLKHVFYKGNDQYTHIYVIVPDPDLDNYIVLDPTNDCKYNSEVQYSTGTLYFLNGKKMELRAMGNPNGDGGYVEVGWSETLTAGCNNMMGQLEDLSVNMMGKKGFHPIRTIVHALAESKQLAKVLPKGSMHKLEQLVNIPLDQQRGSFLLALKHNLEGLADHTAAVLGKDPKAFDKVWSDLGGKDPNDVKKAILEGAKKPKAISGPEYISGKAKGVHLLHALSGILHAVAPIANTIFPGAGNALNGIANKADLVASRVPAKDAKGNLAPPPPLPSDIYTAPGVPVIPGGQSITPGSVTGSIGGFIFKSTLIISMLHINPTLQAVLESTAIAAPLAYVCIKKIKSWQISQFI